MKLLVKTFLLSVLPIISLAQSRYYVGAGAGTGIQFFSPNYELFTIHNAEHGTFAYRIFVGYHINQHFSTEVGYTNFGVYHNEGGTDSFFCFSGNLRQCIPNPYSQYGGESIYVRNTIKSDVIDWSMVYAYPFSQRFSLFAKAGAGYVDVKSISDVAIGAYVSNHLIPLGTVRSTSSSKGPFLSHLNPFVGIGDQYRLSKQLSFRFEYDYYGGVRLKSADGSNGGALYPSVILGELVYSF